jgi:hypothetical protein
VDTQSIYSLCTKSASYEGSPRTCSRKYVGLDSSRLVDVDAPLDVTTRLAAPRSCNTGT